MFATTAERFVSIILEIWQENRKSMSVGNKSIVFD
jgi:hypothetical protein